MLSTVCMLGAQVAQAATSVCSGLSGGPGERDRGAASLQDVVALVGARGSQHHAESKRFLLSGSEPPQIESRQACDRPAENRCPVRAARCDDGEPACDAEVAGEACLQPGRWPGESLDSRS